jgi:transposase
VAGGLTLVQRLPATVAVRNMLAPDPVHGPPHTLTEKRLEQILETLEANQGILLDIASSLQAVCNLLSKREAQVIRTHQTVDKPKPRR